MNRLKHLLRAAVLSALIPFSASAQAVFPSRPVTLVVPFPPGGATDVVARLVSRELSKKLDQPVIVENKAGAGSNIGSTYAARAKPDGHTLLFVTPPFAVNQWLFANPGYKTEQFAPITQLLSIPNVISVSSGSSIRSFDEFAKRIRENPGKLAVGNVGSGSASGLACEMLRVKHDLPFLSISYQGSSPLLTSLLGSHVVAACDSVAVQLPQIQRGNLNALAVFGQTRTALLPSVPSVTEFGFKEAVADGWVGIVAPTGTPDAIVKRLNADLRQILEDPEVRRQLTTMGLEPKASSAEEFSDLIARETARSKAIFKQLGITPQ